MDPVPAKSGWWIKNAGAGVLLLAVVAGGVLVLLYFVNELLRPGDLNALSLPLIALVAAIAAVFNPCAIPALPGFFSFGSGTSESPGPWRRGGLSLMVSLGAMTLVIALGIIVAIVGTGIKDLIAPYFRWVQLALGLFLISIAGLHLAGQTSRLPLVGPIMALGSRMWEQALARPTPFGSYLFGAGFVAVGAGWTAPFLAAVAAYAIGIGGFLTGLEAFLIFGVTMGLVIFLMTFLGAAVSPALAVPLRLWSRRIQVGSAFLIILIGGALIYSSANPGVFGRFVLPK